MNLTDTHCHLDLDRFDADREEVIARANSAGVSRMLAPAINLESAKRILALANQHANIYAAVGVHPNDAFNWTANSADEVRQMVADDCAGGQPKKIVAIGEIGLDHYWKDVPHDVQETAIRQQLALAAELDLPVIVHMREHGDAPQGTCSEALLPIVNEWVGELRLKGSALASRPGVFHSFSGSKEVAAAILEMGFYIGVTGPITYKNTDYKLEVVKSIPFDRLLIETDSPFLAPVPMRGKRNEPANVQYIANALAQIFDESPQNTADKTARNADRLFAWEATF